jgi:hypothetical protein
MKHTQKRYTGKSLENDVAQFNKRLEARNDALRFVVDYRYNYTAVDLATPEQLAQYCTQRTLATGTPRECLNECYRYLAN